MDGWEAHRSLRHINLLGAVPHQMLEELESACEWMRFGPDQIVVDRNDDTSDVYFIVKGRVQVLDFVRGGREVSLVEMGDGETFGEISAIDKKRRSARVRAMQSTEVARLGADLFRETLIRVPDMSVALLRLFANKVRSLSSRVTALSSLSSHQRIYRELLTMAEPDPSGAGSWIINGLPGHAEIAERVDTEREVVAIALGELAKEGIVERKLRTLIIKNYARLQALVDM